MRTLIAFALLIAVTCSANPLDDAWKAYKAKHGKHYVGVIDASRRAIWESNLKKVAEHNAEADRGLHSYRLGMNAFADMVI